MEEEGVRRERESERKREGAWSEGDEERGRKEGEIWRNI